jgi:nucleotide-binding universal stress UspA family protein
MRIKTVLCPVDRSEISEQAMAYAVAVAQQFVARLSVLEVIDWTLPPMSGLGAEFVDLPAELQSQVLAHLNSLVAPIADTGIATEVGVTSGTVVRQILARAADVHADLMVLGTHGRSGFDRLALGSVAEKVLRKASCPVLTVPPGASAPADPPFSKVLCAVDLSPVSRDVVRLAAAFALRSGGKLFVMHVVDWPFGKTAEDSPAGEQLRALQDAARAKLAGLLADAELPPVHISSHVQAGVPKHVIAGCARARQANLIVLGVSGHGAFDRALLGSTTHGVICQSTCPVLTAR